ncbi:MAG: lipid droplet-associated protein [Pseudonocardia sp.]
MKPLPLPVRIAAGLVATAVEQARDLPRLVIEFPITAVSQALQTSMRVQQKVTELAIKGDRALGMLRPVEETPSWATFDDEDEPGHNGPSTRTDLRPQAAARIPVARPPVNEPEPPVETAADVAAATTEAAAGAGDATVGIGDATVGIGDATVGIGDATVGIGDATVGIGESDGGELGLAEHATGPNVLPDYGDMTIPQLRARLRHLSGGDLQTLLEWETAHGDRAPFVTMLTNRITTVTDT